MSANAGALHLPRNRAMPRRARIVALAAAASMAAAGIATYVALRSNSPAAPARPAVAQAQTVPQAAPQYHARFRDLPAIAGAGASVATIAPSSAAWRAKAHLREIAGRRDPGESIGSANDVACPLGRLGPC